MAVLEGELFNRRAEVSIGSFTAGSINAEDGLRVIEVLNPDQGLTDGLRTTFRVEKTTKPDPNTVEVKVYNLSPENRSALEQAEGLVVRLSAGYVDNVFQVFEGDLRRAITVREKEDLITSIDAGDGEKRYVKARINKSFAPNSSTEVIIRALAEAMGVGEGNLADIASGLKLGDIGSRYASGATLSGQAAAELTAFAESVGIDWSIAAGNLLFTKKGKPLRVISRLLTPETGLIGVPTVDNDGVLNARCLMIPDIEPANAVRVEAERVEGTYRIEKAVYLGDTRGQDWYIDIQAKAV